MKRLCTICARGGSKGVPGKNIRQLCGKPLIAWTIESAKLSGLFERIVVSSDDPAILKAATAAGADSTVLRPPEYATDHVSKLPAIRHALLCTEKAMGITFDTLVDLDATSPLRHVEDIVGAVEMLERGALSNVITAAPSRRSPYFNLVEVTVDGKVELSKTLTGKGVSRRQDSPPTYDMNASIYVWRRDIFIKEPAVFYSDTGLFEMPEERSQDIDTLLDFKIVEFLMRERHLATGHPGTDAYDLRGKLAVVTGAAGILGRHFCGILAQHGATIAVVDRMEEDAHALADNLRKSYGVGVSCHTFDVADPAAVKKAVASIEDELGPIDILHNNAATKGADLQRFFDEVAQYRPEVWREVMEVNVDGYFFMAREVGTRMAARGKGSIVQTASIYGIVGPDQRIYEGSDYLGGAINTPAVYAASKAAVVGLTKYFATYWGHRGVRVNTLTPGGVSSGQNSVFDNKYSSRVPLARMARPEEMAHGLLFLASDASSYITGHNLIIDGGLTAW